MIKRFGISMEAVLLAALFALAGLALFATPTTGIPDHVLPRGSVLVKDDNADDRCLYRQVIAGGHPHTEPW